MSYSPISRNTDPQSSHDAEETHTLGPRAVRQWQVLRLIEDYPAHTSGELSRHFLKAYPDLSITIAAETPHKRASDLEGKGLVFKGPFKRRCLDTGYECHVWYTTEAGRRELGRVK